MRPSFSTIPASKAARSGVIPPRHEDEDSGGTLKLLEGIPLPDGEQGKQVQQWLAETKADAEQRYWGNRLIAAAEAKNAGDPDRARKIFEDVGARCPDKEIVKMAHQELTLMGK